MRFSRLASRSAWAASTDRRTPPNTSNSQPGIEAYSIEFAVGAVAAVATAAALGGRSGCIDDGEQSGPIDAPEGARFSNTCPGVLQLEVSLHGALHQTGEVRILECRPPLGQGERIRSNIGQSILKLVIPSRGDVGFGFDIIGPTAGHPQIIRAVNVAPRLNKKLCTILPAGGHLLNHFTCSSVFISLFSDQRVRTR